MNWFKKNQKKKSGDDLSLMTRGESATLDEEGYEEVDNNPNDNQTQGNSGTGTATDRRRKRSKAGDEPLPPLFVGDKILLANKKTGKVTSIGPKPNKRGIWVRVVMDSRVTSDGVFDDTNKTIWVPKQRVERILHRGKKFNLTIGDRVVYVKKRTHGVIKYVGPTHFDKGVWFGVELDASKGKNNGTVKKKFYFDAKHNHGVMLPFKRIVPETPAETPSSPKTPNPPKSPINLNRSNDNNNNNNNNNSSNNNSNNTFFIEEEDMPTSNRKKLIPKEKQQFVGFKPLVDEVAKVEPSPSVSSTPKPSGDELVSNGTIDKYWRRSFSGELGLMLDNYLQKSHKLSGIALELYDSDLLSITEYGEDEREDIFTRKLYFCRAKCDFFVDTPEMVALIAKKEKLLLELSEFIARHVWFKEKLYERCLASVGQNLFRALPFQDRPPALSFFNDEVFDKDSNFEDPSWRHLKLVYDLTWRVINTPMVTAQMMEKYMTGSFLKCLVELFASEDHRERAYLMMILHKIYGRCLKLRPYIIQIMCGYFYRMIYTSEFAHVNGIIELLQIICAIIPGLTVPVKASWQSFVRNVLVPLHKCRRLKKFWEQLTQCCVNYVAKDGAGGAVILGGLLRFWPQQSPQKEEIFIMEVVNIINVLITHQHGFVYETYKEILVAAATKLTDCMLSTRQPVAERAIAAWKEQSMQRLVDYDRKAFLPKLCEAFYRNSEHQNQALKQNSCSVEKIYRSKDSAYWKKMQQYLSKKDRKENAIARAIDEAQNHNRDPYEIVLEKHAKEKLRGRKAKPLTTAERRVRRTHSWSFVRANAQENRSVFVDVEENDNNNNNENTTAHTTIKHTHSKSEHSQLLLAENEIAMLFTQKTDISETDDSNTNVVKRKITPITIVTRSRSRSRSGSDAGLDSSPCNSDSV